MRIVAEYDFNNGKDAVLSKYKKEYKEIIDIVHAVDANIYKSKVSKEKTMKDEILFAPTEINPAFKKEFGARGWNPQRIKCDYIYGTLLDGYIKDTASKGAFREMDFIKPGKKLGVEVQFGKYAFMVYNVCAKMTIFHNEGIIDTGIEIVPVQNFAKDMSSGVSYFEQFAWDLTKRGTADIDIPVLILGIDK